MFLKKKKKKRSPRLHFFDL